MAHGYILNCLVSQKLKILMKLNYLKRILMTHQGFKVAQFWRLLKRLISIHYCPTANHSPLSLCKCAFWTTPWLSRCSARGRFLRTSDFSECRPEGRCKDCHQTGYPSGRLRVWRSLCFLSRTSGWGQRRKGRWERDIEAGHPRSVRSSE
jgi:hypothetical protein